MSDEEGAITTDRSVLAYIRFDVFVPDKINRSIAQKKMLKGQIKNILQHFLNFTHFREILTYVDRVALLTVKGCPFLCSFILVLYQTKVKRFSTLFYFSSHFIKYTYLIMISLCFLTLFYDNFGNSLPH